MTQPKSLPPAMLEEIERLGAASARLVQIMRTTAPGPDQVEARLRVEESNEAMQPYVEAMQKYSESVRKYNERVQQRGDRAARKLQRRVEGKPRAWQYVAASLVIVAILGVIAEGIYSDYASSPERYAKCNTTHSSSGSITMCYPFDGSTPFRSTFMNRNG